VHDDPSLAAPSTSSSTLELAFSRLFIIIILSAGSLDEKKAKKKARKAAIKMQEGTKKSSFNC